MHGVLHAHSRSRSNADPTPLPLHKLRWWPKNVEWRPHLHVRQRRRSNNTRKHSGSIRDNLSVGQQVKGVAARWPP